MSQKTKTSKASSKALAASSKEIMGDTRASRQAYFAQLQDALQTGGASGRIPILNAALAGSQYGESTALKDTANFANRAGLGGSDVGAMIGRGVSETGGMTTSGTREAIIRELLGQAPNAALGAAQQGTAGLQQSAARNAQLLAQNQQIQGQEIGSGAAAAGAIAGALILASRRRFKEDIVYITQGDEEHFSAAVRDMHLATYRYKGTNKQRLGLIIDDLPDGSIVVDGDGVDIYGLLSMAIATIQHQERRIAELEAKVR